MSAILHTPHYVWARAHRAALVIVLLAMALAATAGLLVARIVSDAGAAPATSVSTVHVPRFVPVPTPAQDNCPQMGRRGQTPC
jgi:hypothetical protein